MRSLRPSCQLWDVGIPVPLPARREQVSCPRSHGVGVTVGQALCTPLPSCPPGRLFRPRASLQDTSLTSQPPPPSPPRSLPPSITALAGPQAPHRLPRGPSLASTCKYLWREFINTKSRLGPPPPQVLLEVRPGRAWLRRLWGGVGVGHRRSDGGCSGLTRRLRSQAAGSESQLFRCVTAAGFPPSLCRLLLSPRQLTQQRWCRSPPGARRTATDSRVTHNSGETESRL